jgi:hypothetical protein
MVGEDAPARDDETRGFRRESRERLGGFDRERVVFE